MLIKFNGKIGVIDLLTRLYLARSNITSRQKMNPAGGYKRW
jgi:hypothetical protein